MDSDLNIFSIVSPEMMAGMRKNVPAVSLPSVFTEDAENVYVKDSEIHRLRMRLPEFLESVYSAGTVTVTSGSKTVTLSTNTWASATTHLPDWSGRTITISDTVGGIDIDCIIATVTYNASNSVITLTENYPGNSAAGESYVIGTPGTAVQTPDGNAVLRYHKLTKTSGGAEIEYIFAFTEAHAYLWSTGWSAWILKFTCASDVTFWSTESYREQVVATNYSDKVQIWGGTVNDLFDDLGSASGIDIGGGTYLTAAKLVFAHDNYLILAYVIVDGTVYLSDFYWSSYNDETDFDQTGTGDTGNIVIGGDDPIVAVTREGGDLIFGKKESTHRYWLVTDTDVWQGDQINDIGWMGGHAYAHDKNGRLFFLADDFNIREVRTPFGLSKPMSDVFAAVNTSLVEYSDFHFFDEHNFIAMSIPVGAEATGNNKVVIYDPEYNRWSAVDAEVPAFGHYRRQAVYQWSTLPFDSWSAWGWDRWSDVENVIGFPIDLASDYNGYSYAMHAAQLDNGSAYTGYAVIATSLTSGKSDSRYNKIHQMQLIVYNEGAGTLTVEIKRDSEASWQTAGSISLNDSSKAVDKIIRLEFTLNTPLRAQDFLIKISGANMFRIVGLLIGHLEDGYE